jgi:hypothetical protein
MPAARVCCANSACHVRRLTDDTTTCDSPGDARIRSSALRPSADEIPSRNISSAKDAEVSSGRGSSATVKPVDAASNNCDPVTRFMQKSVITAKTRPVSSVIVMSNVTRPLLGAEIKRTWLNPLAGSAPTSTSRP